MHLRRLSWILCLLAGLSLVVGCPSDGWYNRPGEPDDDDTFFGDDDDTLFGDDDDDDSGADDDDSGADDDDSGADDDDDSGADDDDDSGADDDDDTAPDDDDTAPDDDDTGSDDDDATPPDSVIVLSIEAGEDEIFPTLLVGSSYQVDVTIENQGGGFATVNVVLSFANSVFSINPPTTFILVGGTSVVKTITFTPQTAASYATDFQVSHDGSNPSPQVIAFTGVGITTGETACSDGVDNDGDCPGDTNGDCPGDTNGDCPGDTNNDGVVCGPGDVGYCEAGDDGVCAVGDTGVDCDDSDCLGDSNCASANQDLCCFLGGPDQSTFCWDTVAADCTCNDPLLGDPFCCSVGWDQACVDSYGGNCGADCSAAP